MAQRLERRSGVGTVVVALVLIVVGGDYLLKSAFGSALPEPDSEVGIPAIAVIIGLALLYRAASDRGARIEGSPQRG
jgi:protein-S-isoprenylcysteine O-methyltransferase Ste14